jgi:putative toxin-antitoxin system antitoxin component (TIGR02293 family)
MSSNKLLDPEVSYTAIEAAGLSSFLSYVKSGVKFSSFIKFVGTTPFSLAEWASFLHLSERTMQRYQKEKKSFDTPQSEKILEIAIVYKKGIEVFNNAEQFNYWLSHTSIALGNKTPKSFLDTNRGLQFIKEELHRIEHGIYS